MTKVKGDFTGANPFPGDGVERRPAQDDVRASDLLRRHAADAGVQPRARHLLASTASGTGGTTRPRLSPAGEVHLAERRHPDGRPQPGALLAARARSSRSPAAPTTGSRGCSSSGTTAAINPLTQVRRRRGPREAQQHDPADNHGWGWNAGDPLQARRSFSIGASYRSKITIDYNGRRELHADPDRQPASRRARRLPASSGNSARHDVDRVSRRSLNLGMAFDVRRQHDALARGGLDAVVRVLAPRTSTSTNPAIPALDRTTNWKDSWAYRVGVEQKFGELGDPRGLLPRQDAAARSRTWGRSSPTTTATATRSASATTGRIGASTSPTST